MGRHRQRQNPQKKSAVGASAAVASSCVVLPANNIMCKLLSSVELIRSHHQKPAPTLGPTLTKRCCGPLLVRYHLRNICIVLHSGLLAGDRDSQKSRSDVKKASEDVAGYHSDSEGSTSFYSARNPELSDLEASDDDETLEQPEVCDTESETLDNDWELLDDYAFEEELFLTRTFDETQCIT